jgi:hypothetical protein
MGYITRDEGVELVKKYDHIKPRIDLNRWLEYTGITEEEFDTHADTYRDTRVWHKKNDKWTKNYNLWD